MSEQEEKFTLSINPYEAGVLMGVITKQGAQVRSSLSGVYKQLVALKNRVEEAAGVAKKILPGGMLEISDRDGNKIIRAPYAWEIEGN